MPGQSKKSLNTVIAGCYIFLAVTVLMVGRCNPLQLQATTDASVRSRVFFVVMTLFAFVRQIMAWCTHSGACRAAAVMPGDVHHSAMSMVAQAGPTPVGPVSCNAGIATPVWAIASERCNSCDSMNSCYRRLPLWLPTQPKNTQNPRSPNLATTVAVRFTVRRWCRFIFLLICCAAILILSRHGCRTSFPVSMMILRL
ncbi:ash family protein [Salmonella enterica]|nr:ash family protein [Salmonella enterica]EGL7478655.1 ash family protein [Salmonella enterica]EIZ2335440.1 ash family protein [Salmonella enterica]